MTKKELEILMKDYPDDAKLVFPNVEYGGYEEINRVFIVNAKKITEDGKEALPETGADYINSNEKDRTEWYQNESEQVILLTKYNRIDF